MKDHPSTENCCSHNHHKTEAITEKTNATIDTDENRSVFEVSGMDCADEVQAIKKAFSQERRVRSVEANLMTSKVTLVHSKDIAISEISNLIAQSGVRVVSKSVESPRGWLHFFSRTQLVALSGIFCGVGLLLEFAETTKILTDISYILSVLAGGVLVFPKALRSLRHKNLDMNVLMTVAVVGAFAIGSHSEAAAVVFLFSLAEFLESLSVQRARRAIADVLKLDADESVLINSDGSATKVRTENVKIGQRVKVLTGERIPLDGVVVSGEASINEAPLTGESTPIQKVLGMKVFAGTLCENGTLVIEVTHLSTDSKLSHIIKLVEDAQATKAPSQRFVDKFSKVYTPAVFIVAILIALVPLVIAGQPWHPWVYRALVLLVIACPCALVIATPVAIVSALTGLAKQGVLVKGGAHLETLGKLRALAIDKTGTLTEGKPKVLAITSFEGSRDAELLQVAASLESESTHPLARAILDRASQDKLNIFKVSEIKTIHGRGLQGKVNGHIYFLGNHRLVHEMGLCSPHLETMLSDVEIRGRSIVVVGHYTHDQCPGNILGVIELGDALRADSIEALKRLKEKKLEHIAVLSGDNDRTVKAITAELAVDSAKGDLLPEDKVSAVRELKNRFSKVAMLGDGINDAPAMAEASLGISMGASGTDTALETSDVALMKDDLGKVASAIVHARKTVLTIKANIAFALGTKAIFILLLAFGVSSMWVAVAADMGASLFVVATSLRLLKV